LGWEIPVYVHLPLLQNALGQKISKRNGDASIRQLLEMGFLPEAIINCAALLGWSPPDNREIFSLDELIKIFEPKNISKSPSTFDMVKLKWVNGEHIKAMPFEQYRDLALPFLKEAVKKPWGEGIGVDYDYLAEITQSRVNIVNECAELVDFIDNLPEYSLELFTHKKMKTNEIVALRALIWVCGSFDMISDSKVKAGWNAETLSDCIAKVVESSTSSGGLAQMAELLKLSGGQGLTKGQILWSLRTALSGKATTPCGAMEICVLLGKKETLVRIEKAIDRLKISVDLNQ
jgi:glutamyl-tRNA synthetase